MEIPLLTDIITIFGIAIAVLLLCNRLRVPAVVGFLLTGVFVGPHGIGLIEPIDHIEIFAQVGVVLLLFTIGIEFSLERLLQIRRSVLLCGSLQVCLTFIAVFFITKQLDQAFGKAVFIGFLAVLSSTAIVLKLLQERAEIDSPHGRTALGILIFQDIIVVPMILVTPIITGATGNVGQSLLVLLLKGIGIIFLVLVSAKWVVPQVLYQIARTRNNELFLLSVVVICFGVAWLTSKAGVSLALGAFLAGLIISESEYSHHSLGNILPFRDVFTTFFFVSIGMMLDIRFFLQQSGFIALAALCVFMLKAIIAGSVTISLGFPLRTGVLVGCALGQIGEFSFILSRIGIEHGVLTGDMYQTFLAVTIITMAATPFIIPVAPRLADAILRLPLPKGLVSGRYPVSEIRRRERRDHLIIIGFGVNGRHVAGAAGVAGIPYAIIEMNPYTVRNERAKGEPICYGDATQEAVLQNANIKLARIVVVAINDPTATRRITELVRRLNPTVYLLVRTRYLEEMKPLYGLGANEVIPEEFETSVEIFARVLAKYLVPRHEIERLIAEARTDGYEMLRSISEIRASFSDLKLQLHDVDISAFQVPSASPLLGKTLEQIGLRRHFGVSVVGIRRGSEIVSNPGADTLIQSDDVLFVLGTPERISETINAFSPANRENGDP
jgi:CPA2 family monovalent cation:H+ antiporter-2